MCKENLYSLAENLYNPKKIIQCDYVYMLNSNSGMWKWPKIKFGPRIFVTDIINKLMCKINERKQSYLNKMAEKRTENNRYWDTVMSGVLTCLKGAQRTYSRNAIDNQIYKNLKNSHLTKFWIQFRVRIVLCFTRSPRWGTGYERDLKKKV
jgi:hypothetical protein